MPPCSGCPAPGGRLYKAERDFHKGRPQTKAPPMFEVSAEIAALLILAAFFAGLVDSIAGGGGLITIPALLLAGVPPVMAIATNKLQGSFGAGAAFLVCRRAGSVRLRDYRPGALIAAVAVSAGTFGSHLIPADILRLIIPVFLVAVAVFFALKPGLTDENRPARLSPILLSVSFVPLVAAYDGFAAPAQKAEVPRILCLVIEITAWFRLGGNLLPSIRLPQRA